MGPPGGVPGIPGGSPLGSQGHGPQGPMGLGDPNGPRGPRPGPARSCPARAGEKSFIFSHYLVVPGVSESF